MTPQAALNERIEAIDRAMSAAGGGLGEAAARVQRQAPAAPPRRDDHQRRADLKAKRDIEIQEIRLGLHNNAESLAMLLMGEKPTSRNGHDWRFFPKGGFKITVSGPKRGLWHDHGANEGGDMLALIQKRQGLAFVNALAWARDYLGMPAPDYSRAMTSAERDAARRHLDKMAALQAQQNAAHEAELGRRHNTVARRCAAAWAGSAPAPHDNPYLVAKGIQPHSARVDRRGRLRLPMHDFTGKIWALQWIWVRAGKTEKRFPRRARAHGMFMVLGKTTPGCAVLFVEGFATGASVHEATGQVVVVTFSVGGKEVVMTEWRRRHPDQMLVDAADNDHAKARMDPPMPNAGAAMAEKLQHSIRAVPALPPFKPEEAGTDWNDYAKLHGLDAARVALREAIRASLRAMRS